MNTSLEEVSQLYPSLLPHLPTYYLTPNQHIAAESPQTKAPSVLSSLMDSLVIELDQGTLAATMQIAMVLLSFEEV
jgi:hypothetical protein